MLNTIKQLLLNLANNINSDNCSISEKEALELIHLLEAYSAKAQNNRLSKYKACEALKVSRATFDNLVKQGKLPKGKKEEGFKELSWDKKDIDNYINNTTKKCY